MGDSLDKVVVGTALKLLGPLDEESQAQLRIGTEERGCELRSAELRAHTAYLSTALRLHPHVLHGAGAAATAARKDCEASIAFLATRGVHIDAHGVGHTAPQASALQLNALPGPLKHRQRSWLKSADVAHIRTMSQHAQDRLASSGGPEGGAYLHATRGEVRSMLTDAEWLAYTRMRLGATVSDYGTCQLQRVTQDGARTVCGARLDRYGKHCVSCKVGGAVLAAHAESNQVLADACREAGYTSRREQVVPELATAACPNPVLDVDAFGVAGSDRLLLDFTLRNQAATRYQRGGRSDPTRSAEEDKQARYPPRGGVAVRGLAMEVLGRHGPGLAALLQELADRARVQVVQQGRAPGRYLRTWRTRLSVTAARLVGRAVTLATARPPPPNWEDRA